MAGYQRPFGRDAFKVAVLCATNVQVSAVESLMDENWESQQSYGRAPNDPNSYKIGRIAHCNVVLAYIPEMGNSPAMKTAIGLKASFPNIQLALLVGICSGTPCTKQGNAVFLGDVVISTGLVQYDLGRLYANTFTTKTGTENNLSISSFRVRFVLEKLQAGETRKKFLETTHQNLLNILDTQSVEYPGLSRDRLYQPSYRHKHQNSRDCAICANCSSENDEVCDTALIASCEELGCSNEQTVLHGSLSRLDISEGHVSKPSIHFGRMASGNFALRSSMHRDRITKAEDVIAFEGEGAAVWEEFPTIIIKSVCDYADSHKIQDWERYAACTAAACLKAVIGVTKMYEEDTSFQVLNRGQDEFAIPPSELDTAVKVKMANQPSIWSYKMYRDSRRNAVKVHYSTDLESSEQLAKQFVNEPVVGFGMHWLVAGKSIIPPGETTEELNGKYNISLIVLAKEDSICIFQISSHLGNTTEQKIAPTLRSILESPNPLKAGVAIFQFKDERLLIRFGIRLKGIFELADLHRLVKKNGNDVPEGEPSKWYTPLNDLVEEHLYLDHFRPKQMQLSNWARRPLEEAQMTYAANDAYAGFQLFQTMNAKRKKLRPVPPLPPRTEEQSVEQIKERGLYWPIFSTRKRALSESQPTSPTSSPSASQEGNVEEVSPSKKRRYKDTSLRRSLYPNIVDPQGKFVWSEGRPVFNFGREMVGRSLQDVAVTNRGYLGWMTDPEQMFSSHVVKLARDALNGIFPTQPEQEAPIDLTE